MTTTTKANDRLDQAIEMVAYIEKNYPERAEDDMVNAIQLVKATVLGETFKTFQDVIDFYFD